MASIIIASIALALTLLVYLYGAWRFLRFPRFWVMWAHVELGAASGKTRAIEEVTVSVAYRGGGQPRAIIDVGFVVIQGGEPRRVIRSHHGWLEEVIPVPSELAGRFTMKPPGGLALDDLGKEILCALRLDCGGEYFEAPFTVHKTTADLWTYVAPHRAMSAARAPRSWLLRPFDWIRSR